MYRRGPKAASVAAIGILASTASFQEVAAVQLSNAHKFADAGDWNPDLADDQTLLDTKKQLDEVEHQLNQMKAETEVNLEIAEAESLES